MSLTGKEIAQMHKDYVMQSWSKSGVDALPVERAEGIYFYDYDGKKYADMASLLVCSNLGHELPEIVEAIKKQADKMCFMAPAYASEPKSVLAKMLVELAGADIYKRVFFTNGGAESNENAIKMARMVTGRTKIFSCYRSYHGATLGASNASGDWRRYAAEIGGANGFVHFMNPQMYRDGYTKGVDDAEVTKKYLDALDLQLRYEGPQNVAAIVMESIVGANGVILPPDGYMEGVRALFDNNYIYSLIKTIINEHKVVHTGDGNEIREYIHASAVASMAADVIASEEYANQYMILTGVERMKRKELFEMIREILGEDFEVILQNSGYVNHYRITPYSFQPTMSRKMVANTYVDMGQGILECIKQVYKEKENDKYRISAVDHDCSVLRYVCSRYGDLCR